MKNFMKTASVLGSICAVSAMLLALVNSFTSPAIKAYENDVVRSALEEVACGNTIGDRTDVTDNNFIEYYHSLEKNNKVVGYILGLKSNGYGGELVLIAGYTLDGSVISAKLVSDSETPGVGKKAENSEYMDKFVGKGGKIALPVSKDMLNPEETASVSGATMTFNGVSRGISAGSEFVKSKLGGN